MEITQTESVKIEPEEADFDSSEEDIQEEEMQQLLRTVFVKYNQLKFDEIKNAIDSGEIKSAHRLAHTLKGNAGQVGKMGLFKIAEKIELLLWDGNLPIPDDAMALLESELSLVLEEFRPLLEETREADGPPDAGQAQGALKAPDEARVFRVFIINDNDANARALTRIIEPEYIVCATESGPEAIKSVTEYLPDVVLLDFLKPGADGYAIITALKSSEKTKEIPIIFFTGQSDASAEEKALSLGAADYITKPYSPTVVRLRIRNQIQIGKLRREAESAPEAAQAASSAESDFLAGTGDEIRALMNAEFLRNIGHELKTALTRIHAGIINAEDLLDYGMDKDEMRESLQDAGREIMKMAKLINGEISRFSGEENADG